MSMKSESGELWSRSAQEIRSNEGMKWRLTGSAFTISRSLEQSSKRRYFLNTGVYLVTHDNRKRGQAYFSRSSETSPRGVHSKMISPGYAAVVELREVDRGMENADSVTHEPECGMSNLRSIQMAVASLSGFRESQISQGRLRVDELTLLTWARITCRKDPWAHRSSCSS